MFQNDLLVLVGSGSQLGRVIYDVCDQKKIHCHCISANAIARSVVGVDGFSRGDVFDDLCKELLPLALKNRVANVVLSHRVRTADPLKAICIELTISRDLVVYLASKFDRLKVTYIGSITGGLVDRSSDEAYHLTKDIQKSICRYLTINNPKIIANILRLSAFKKYDDSQATILYKQIISDYQSTLGSIPLLTLVDIANEVIRFTIKSEGFRGCEIPLDSGYSIIQG